MKFQQNVFGSFSSGDGTGTEMLLNADGTYTGLRLFEFRQGASPFPASSVVTDISIPRNGIWAYRVVDQATAEIMLDGSALILHFSEGTLSGNVGDSVPRKPAPYFTFTAYDATTRLANCSTRCFVAPGRGVSLGFVISAGERRVLVRAIGPGLRAFGVTQPLEAPRMRVYSAGSSSPVDSGQPDTSRATLDIAAQRAGAFPLPSANDSGKYLTLEQGAYIVEVDTADGAASGEVLVEVYQLP